MADFGLRISIFSHLLRVDRCILGRDETCDVRKKMNDGQAGWQDRAIGHISVEAIFYEDLDDIQRGISWQTWMVSQTKSLFCFRPSVFHSNVSGLAVGLDFHRGIKPRTVLNAGFLGNPGWFHTGQKPDLF